MGSIGALEISAVNDYGRAEILDFWGTTFSAASYLHDGVAYQHHPRKAAGDLAARADSCAAPGDPPLRYVDCVNLTGYSHRSPARRLGRLLFDRFHPGDPTMSYPPPSDRSADFDLLVGVLAVQMGFVSPDSLIASLNARTLCDRRPLAELLMERGLLTGERRELLEERAAEQLRLETAKAGQSLDALVQATTVHEPVPSRLTSPLHLSLSDGAGSFTSAPRPNDSAIRYEVVRFHARGGLGVVSVARDRELGREVALKEMHADRGVDCVNRGRFLREAEITGALEHPGIVPIYGLGYHADGRPYYAMRFIRGETLHEAIRKLHAGEANYSLRGLLTRFVSVCNAVAYAHSRGVIHRDLKPSNVMLGPYGETLVVDWGLAKIIGDDGGDKAGREPLQSLPGGDAETRTGSALGTPAFMSPEQARGEVSTLQPATDVFCLGATLYAIVTGRAPIEGRNSAEVLDRARLGRWIAPRRVKPNVPPPLDAVCHKAMAFEPSERYASALQLSNDIERWLDDEPVAAYPEPWIARGIRWMRRHRTPVVAVVAACTAAAVFGLGVYSWRLQEQARRDQEDARREEQISLRRAEAAGALEQAILLRDQARWADARVAVERAEGRLAEDEQGALRERVDGTKRDLGLVTALDEIRLQRAMGQQQGNLITKSDQGYEIIFKRAGIGAPQEDASKVARRVTDSPIRETLIAALDDWALVSGGKRRAWALEVARQADPNPRRNALREPAAWADPEVLAKLAREIPPEALTPGLAAAVGSQLSGVAEGEALLRVAQSRRPGDVLLNATLGSLLSDKGRFEEAEGFYRAALAERPESTFVTSGLGAVLAGEGRIEEAAELYLRVARQIGPARGSSKGMNAGPLGWVPTREKGRGPGAGEEVVWQAAGGFFPEKLLERSKYKQAREFVRGALDLYPAPNRVRPILEAYLKQAEAGERLQAVLDGKLRPSNAAEELDFAKLCFMQRRYAASARFYEGAMQADPELNDRSTSLRYGAACAAALAASGKGIDAPETGDVQRSRWRAKSLAWLGTDLKALAIQVSGGAKDRSAAINSLRHYLSDPDLAGVRSPSELANLAEPERKDWEALWAQVRMLIGNSSDK